MPDLSAQATAGITAETARAIKAHSDPAAMTPARLRWIGAAQVGGAAGVEGGGVLGGG